jgi:HK97 family phage major capsid protein
MAEWSAGYVSSLPDSAFACIDAGGEKDADGKTVPRSLRHYPHHDAAGKVDEPHLAAARARVNQEGTTSCGHDHLFQDHEMPSDMPMEKAMPQQGTERQRPPRDNLVRAVFPGTEIREEGTVPRLYGHFAVFNQWTKIDSVFEGTFMERVAPGSFAKTFAENRSRFRITLNHGKDPELGDKPIAVPDVLEEDRAGAYYDSPLLDGVPPLVVAGLRAKQYASSFRFRVIRDDFERKTKASDYNPDALPERTIREIELFEFGPVTYPAYAGATASVRSLTDDYIRHLLPPEAPSVDAGAAPHLEPERRDPPAQSPPPIAAPTPKDPPEGGSSDSRSQPVELTTIEDKRARVTELKEALARQAVAYPGVLPEDEQASWDADSNELSALDRDVAAWDARLARVASYATDPKKVDGGFEPPRVNQINRKSEADIYSFEPGGGTLEERNQKWRDDAMRATEIATFPHPHTDVERTKDRIAWLLDHHDSPDKELARRIKATGSPLYKRAFEKLVQGRGTMFLSPEELRGTALAVGVDGTGGFSVPFAFDPTIIAIGAYGGAVNPYRRICRVVPIVGTDTWNALTATAVVATRTTEAAVTVEQGPTFAQPQYIVTRVQGQITLSHEMAQDRPNLASEMGSLIQEAKDNEEENSMAVGATAAANIGVIPVNGTSGAYTSLTTATSVTLAAADADATEAALPVRHRFGAQWIMNRANIRRFQALETTGGKLFGGNQYPAVGTPGIDSAGNTGLRLLGYPVNESPSAPTAGTANIMIATLFAPSSYVIVDRIGTSIKFIPFIFGAAQGNLVTGQEAIYFMWRNTAHPINVDAGRALRFLT